MPQTYRDDRSGDRLPSIGPVEILRRGLVTATTFREMMKMGKEPIPHDEIVAVTAIVHAGAKSLQEKSRLVELAEVGGERRRGRE